MVERFGKIVVFMATALFVLAPGLAQAQQSGPYYFTPKILYSRQNIDNFNGRENFGGWDMGRTNYNGESKTEDAFGGGAAIGYDFNVMHDVPIRAELEYLFRSRTDSEYDSQRTAELDRNGNWMDTSYKTETSTQSLFANFYYDFHNESAFTPYIGAGLGGAYTQGRLISQYSGRNSIDLGNMNYVPNNPAYNMAKEREGTHDSWNFAWNLSAGAAYQFTDSIALDLSYRYSDLGKAEYGTRGWYSRHTTTDMTDPLNPVPVTVDAGTYNAKADADLVNHEVILGLRFSGF